MANNHNPQQELKLQTGSFILSLVLTVIAFAVVAMGVEYWVAIAIILVLAVIQVFLQLYIFMHLKDQGTSFPRLFIASGALIALVTAIAFLYAMG